MIRWFRSLFGSDPKLQRDPQTERSTRIARAERLSGLPVEAAMQPSPLLDELAFKSQLPTPRTTTIRSALPAVYWRTFNGAYRCPGCREMRSPDAACKCGVFSHDNQT